ncbi:MAG TPA: LLM class F420-dependent oxidoreductase [Solirubrobacteraceae bacterium]
MLAQRTSLGRVGVWSRELRFQPDRAAAADAAQELEALGYRALFIPDVGGDVLGAVEELLTATSTIAIATGIINIWMHDASAIAAGVSRLAGEERMLAGLGVGHAANVDVGAPGRYVHPLSKMRGYLDELDGATPPLPAPSRILAGLGPRMLELSRDRAAGAHPYLVTSEHTARAREMLGPDRLLAPEQGVVLSDDPALGREIARAHVADYLRLPNYVANLRRLGFADEDLAGNGSARLVDALVVHGDEQRIAERVAEHLGAGADHVCIQVVGQRDEALAVEDWRRLAPALTRL